MRSMLYALMYLNLFFGAFNLGNGSYKIGGLNIIATAVCLYGLKVTEE